MNNQGHLIENSSHPGNFHEKIASLLDAYSTNELEYDEQQEVEQHLTSCNDCQHLLATIQHFRELFTKLTDDRYSDTNGRTVLVLHDRQSSVFVDRVLNEIAAKRGEILRQEPISEIPHEHLPTKRSSRRMSWPPSLSLVAAVLCIGLLTGSLLVMLTYLHQVSRSPMNAPAALNWEMQQGPFLVHTTQGIFSIKHIDITPREFRFFYAFGSPHLGVPRVEVLSSFPSRPGPSTRLFTTIQSLGQLGAFTVGVVHTQRLNRAGQVIVLQITSTGSSMPAWRLTLLKQLRNDSSSSSAFAIQQTELPDIFWYGPVMLEQVAFFKSTRANPPGSPSGHIFVRLDDPIVVKVITQAEYIALAGLQNFF